MYHEKPSIFMWILTVQQDTSGYWWIITESSKVSVYVLWLIWLIM